MMCEGSETLVDSPVSSFSTQSTAAVFCVLKQLGEKRLQRCNLIVRISAHFLNPAVKIHHRRLKP